MDYISVKDFGAKGNAVDDDTSAIKNAINQASAANQPSTVYFPQGTYILTSPILIESPITLLGEGNANSEIKNSATQLKYPASQGTTLRRGGLSGGSVIIFKGINHGGFGANHLTIDSATLANFGLEVDGCIGGYFTNVSCFNANGQGTDPMSSADLKVHANDPVRLTTSSWTTFINVFLASEHGIGCELLLTGIPEGNACHCTFVNIHINHQGSRHGIILHGCDNNTFIDTYIYRPQIGSTGHGVHVIPAVFAGQGSFPIANVFHHLQAGWGGWFQPSNTAVSPATIHDFHLDNTPFYPNTSGTPLIYETNQGDSFGRLKGPITATLLNGWQHYQSPQHEVQYFRDSDGFVHLRGLARNANSNPFPTVMLRLPDGYRPLSQEQFLVNSNGSLGACYIDPDGNLTIYQGNRDLVSLSGISFYAKPVLRLPETFA